jgi:hypothetical protein
MTDAPESLYFYEDWLRQATKNRILCGNIKYVRADVSRAAVEAAYIAGLDAADTTTNAFMGQLSSSVPAIEHTDIDALIIAADHIRALKDPAHVRAAVANITEGEG